VASRISSKDLLDKGVLGGHGKEVFLFIFMVGRLVGGDVGKDVKTVDGSGGDWGAGDKVGGTVRDIEEGEVFYVLEGGPGRSRRWRILKLGGLRVNGLEDTGGDIEGTWVIPSVVRALEDLEDGSGGVCDILLINIVKGGPGSDRDMGEGGGGDDGGLRRSERHSILN